MADVRVDWQFPSVRASGRPLNTADIKHTVIEMSADLGANFGVIATVAAPGMTYTQTELEPGEWRFRGYVVDTGDRPGAPVYGSIVIADTTPPGPLQVFTVTLI